MTDPFISNIAHKLKKPLPGGSAHSKMAPTVRNKSLKFNYQEAPRLGAVLILFYKKSNVWHFPLIQRPQYNGVHSGQMALPGGKKELTDKDLIETALRETQEEIGIDSKDVEVAGTLTDFFVGASNFQILPVIGFLKGISPEFILDNYEVAEVVEAQVNHLLVPDYLKNKTIELSPGVKIQSPYFDIEGKVVWGATAMILSELAELLKNE